MILEDKPNPKSKIQNPKSVYLSPHFDDMVLSCGGWAARELASAGRRGLCITVFAAPPPGPLHDFARSLHEQWGEPEPAAANAMRRKEDETALSNLHMSDQAQAWPCLELH